MKMKWIAALAFLAMGLCAPMASASVSKSLSPTSTLTRASFANRFVVPTRPMWQRTYGTLVDLSLGAKRAKRLVARADVRRKATRRPAGKLSQDAIMPRNVPEKDSLHKRIGLPTNPLRIAARKKNAEELREERRTQMAKWHQITGLTTLALLAATMVIGQINAVDFFENRLSPLPMIVTHRILSVATGVTYLTGGILALAFPKDPDADDDDDDDYPSKGFDSSVWHKALAWVHGMGMLGLFTTGIINARLIPSYTDAKVIMTATHLALGYLTLAVLAAAAIMITFF